MLTPRQLRQGVRLFVVVPAITAGLVVAVAGPASAQKRIVRDRVGGAPASADITHVRVRNAPRAVALAVRVQDLRRLSDLTLYVNHGGPGRFVFRTAGTRRGFVTFERGSTTRRVSCAHRAVDRYTGARSTLVVRIPQRCFGRRAGQAAFSLIMFPAGGPSSDTVPAMPFTLCRG